MTAPQPTPRPPRSPLQHLGGHLRDALIRAFPIEMRTDCGLIVRLRNRSEMSVYRNIFVQRCYPFDLIAGELSGASEPVVLDVGANSGQFAAAIFDRWPKARVHSFEPQKELVTRIREFGEINGFQDRHTVNWSAVGGTNGELEFYQNANPISASLLKEKAERRRVRRVVRVPVTTLDDYAQKHGIGRVDILKLDVEGVEMEALRAATNVLKNTRVFFIEFHPPFSRFSEGAALAGEFGLVCINPSPPPSDDSQDNCVFVRKQ